MSFETSPKRGHEDSQDKVGFFSKTEVLRAVAEKRIAQAKSFEDLNLALHELGDVPVEGASLEYSGQELQARITDLRDAIAEAQTPEDINKIEGDLSGITRGLGLRDKVKELIAPELDEKKAEIAGKTIG